MRQILIAAILTATTAPAFAQQLVPGRDVIYRQDGTANAPTNTYDRDRNLGSYRIGADNEGFAANGGLVFDYNASRVKLASGKTLLFNATDISETDIAKIDGITNGTPVAGKAWVGDANAALAIVRTASLRLGTSGAETTVTATGAELNYLSGLTCGTVTASKALCADANKDVSSGRHFSITGGLGVGASTSTNGRIVASEQIIAGSAITAGDNYEAPAGANYFFSGRSRINALAGDGRISFTPNTAASGSLTEQFTNNPTCATNCGTSPTLTGVDSSFTLTMGAAGSPASGFIVTFHGTWAAAPQCTVSMGLAGMAAGKLPLTVVTTTTTATVVTNGTAPANSDVYHFRCSLGQ